MFEDSLDRVVRSSLQFINVYPNAMYMQIYNTRVCINMCAYNVEICI